MHTPSFTCSLTCRFIKSSAVHFSFLEQPFFLTYFCQLLFFCKSHNYQCASNFILVPLFSFYILLQGSFSNFQESSPISYADDSHIYVHGLFNCLLFRSSCIKHKNHKLEISKTKLIFTYSFSSVHCVSE